MDEIAAIDNRMRHSQRSALQIFAYAPNCVEYFLERLIPHGETPRIREIDAEVFESATHRSDVLALAAGVRTDLLRLRNADGSTSRQRAVDHMIQAMGRIRLFAADFDAAVSYAINNWPLGSENRHEHLATIRECHREHLSCTTQWLQSNTGLARTVAMKYRHRGLELDDLVQEGCVGLLRAIDRFEVARGWRFSTYAMWWVRHFIERAIQSQASLIRLPQHLTTGTAANRSDHDFPCDRRNPSAGAVRASANGVSPGLLALRDLDAPVYKRDEGSSGTAIDYIEGHVPTPEDAVIASDFHQHLRRQLNRLPPREAQVLTLLYGFAGDEMNLREVGERLGISGERVRQIRAEALGRLAEYIAFQLPAHRLNDVYRGS